MIATTVMDLDVDPDELTGAGRAGLLLAIDSERSRLEALELRVLGSFDAHSDYAVDGATSAAVWLGFNGDMTRSNAHRMLADARKLRRHPASQNACERIGTARVRELIHRIHARIDTVYADNETELLDRIAGFTVDDTATYARAWARMADFDGPEPPADTPSLRMGRTGNALHGGFSLFDEDAALFENAIDLESNRIYDSEGDDHTLCEQRRANALMNLIRSALGADPNTTPTRPTVIVHMTLDDLEARGARTTEIDGYGPIPAATIQRLLCDANIHRHLSGPNNVTLNLGRNERLVKGWQRLAVIARDRHCQFPGCGRPPIMCHSHHIRHWEHGGNTDLPNLVLLCHQHHHKVHEHGFGCTRNPDGTLTFTRPNGTTITNRDRPG